jgi:hypothetical protein
MSDLSLSETMAVLEPHLEDIDACLRRGFERYGEYPPEIVADHGHRSTTCCIYDHQLMLARKILDPKPGISIIHVKGLEVINFYDRVLMRFKKVNSAGRGRNLQTEQQKIFDRQLSLPGLPPKATRVVAGYNTILFGTAIRKVLISCPLGRTNLWCVQVVLTEEAKWVDITPERFPGTEGFRRYKKNTGTDDAGRQV